MKRAGGAGEAGEAGEAGGGLLIQLHAEISVMSSPNLE